MPLFSPQDIEGIMEMLESLPPEMRQQGIQSLQSQSEYSMPGERTGVSSGYTGRFDNPDPIRAPWAGEHDMPGNFKRGQSMANSMAEDAAIREALGGGRRKREEGEAEGYYTDYMFPGARGQEFAVGMGGGHMGSGAGVGLSPEQQRRARAQEQEFARQQRMRWGVEGPRDAKEFRGRNRRESGMSASDRVNRYLGR